MKQERNLQKGSLAAKLLKGLAEELDYFAFGIYRPSMAFKYGHEAQEILDKKQQRARNQTKKRLIERGFITEKKLGNKIKTFITEKGSRQLFRLSVLEADLLDNDQDCIVVFDIPEDKRNLRKQMRNFLADAGFISIQKSVWISPFDAADSLSDLFRFTGVKKWIRIYTAKEHR